MEFTARKFTRGITTGAAAGLITIGLGVTGAGAAHASASAGSEHGIGTFNVTKESISEVGSRGYSNATSGTPQAGTVRAGGVRGGVPLFGYANPTGCGRTCSSSATK